MSVPSGTLTDEYRAELVAFYGRHLGWREVESLRLPDRLTMSIGGRTYLNIRERSESMTCHGYEHFGFFVESSEEVERIYGSLAGDDRRGVHLESLARGDEGYVSFRVRYLLPLAVEVQFVPLAASVETLP